MHYYQFNIGDYASHTQGLSLLEDIAYRRLIDQYYLSEKPPKGDCLEISRSIGMREHSSEVCYVLEKFFVNKKNGWVHSRVEREISEYKNGQKNKSKAGKASAEARKLKAIENTQENDQQVLSSVEQSLNNCATNHKPITNNHKPINSKQSNTTRAAALDYSCWPSIPSDQVFTDWLDMRKRLKANISQTVINNFASELKIAEQAGYSVDQCLSECVTRNWRGFKFDWMREKQNATHQRASRETLSERANRAADEAFGTGSQSRVLEGCFDILNDNGADQLTGSRGLPDLGQRSG